MNCSSARSALRPLLALCLVAAGEWTRRQEALVSYARVPSAHIPAVLTAAGTTVAYATVYAAYGVYGTALRPELDERAAKVASR